jgi:hypothetical protein
LRIGISFSASAISAINRRLDASLAQFAGRPLAEAFPYLILDARYERVREAGAIDSQAVLIAIGIHWDGRRQAASRIVSVTLVAPPLRNRWFADSPLEGGGFEPVWGFSCQVVVSGLWPVFCSEQESRFSSRRLRSGLRSARKGSRDRNASKLSGVPHSGACVSQRLEA